MGMVLVVVLAAGTAEERDDLTTLNLAHRGFLFFIDSRLLTCCNHLPENIGVLAIVEAELKLREIERQIFFAHVVIRPDDPALEQRPERFDAFV